MSPARTDRPGAQQSVPPDADVDVDVTHAVKHFRFTVPERGTRRLHKKPGVPHVEACRPWLAAELDAVRPELGRVPRGRGGRASTVRPSRS